MSFKQDSPAVVLATKPSSSFSTISSAASATSIASSRSGGSRLLFGEIDTSSERSSENYGSVCSLVLSDSSTFLRFWLKDGCRERLLSHLPKQDLAKLRLVCHDFSVRAAPALFQDLSITFKNGTFTKPARLAALDRLGFYVKTLKFRLPHTADTFLPPLIEPETGEELSFTYTPQTEPPSLRRPKYGDEGTTEILTRQYPPLFHAATNVSAFIRGFSPFVNLSHLKISCPGYDASQRYRRSTVDFALISLRIAIERNCLNALDTLTLSPIHPSGILHLSPVLGYGATPGSARRWSRIKNVIIHAYTFPSSHGSDGQPDFYRLLPTYMANFQHNLRSFDFCWRGQKGPLPFTRPVMPETHTGQHPAHAPLQNKGAPTQHPLKRKKTPRLPFFPHLEHIYIENVATTAADLSSLVQLHKRTIEELDLENVELTQGTWEEAFTPLNSPRAQPRTPVISTEMADIPIMLSPTTGGSPLPSRVAMSPSHPREAKGARSSRWLGSKPAARKVREGLVECEEQLKKVLRGSIGLWR